MAESSDADGWKKVESRGKGYKRNPNHSKITPGRNSTPVHIFVDLETVGFAADFDFTNLAHSSLREAGLDSVDDPYHIDVIHIYGLYFEHQLTVDKLRAAGLKVDLFFKRKMLCGPCRTNEPRVQKQPLLEMTMMNEICREALRLQRDEVAGKGKHIIVYSSDPFFDRLTQSLTADGPNFGYHVHRTLLPKMYRHQVYRR